MLASTGRRTAVVCALLSPLTGCGGSATERPAERPSESSSDLAPVDPDDGSGKSAWEACYASFAPTGEAKNDLSRLVRNCGATGGMKPVTGVRLGQQSDQDPVDRFTFEVPSAGMCYRVYAAADGSVEDMDLLLRGPNDGPVLADVTHDAWPVLPPRQPACFPTAGLYMLEVSVHRGGGRYALQVWGR